MKTLYLIRHAQSAANAGGQSLPDRDIPLSPLGQQQAQALVAQLPAATAVYVSQMRRTHETAAPYCQTHGLTARILPELNEFSCLSIDLIRGLDGSQRRPLTDAYWQRADVDERTGIGADTFGEFDQGTDAFLQQWCDLPDGSLLFGHGIWIGMLAWKLMGFCARSSADMRAFRAFQTALPMPNAAIWQLHGTANQPLGLRYSYAKHSGLK